MSGLLRRIKRARAAGGEPSAEGGPTATGGAPVTPDPAAGPAGGASAAPAGDRAAAPGSWSAAPSGSGAGGEPAGGGSAATPGSVGSGSAPDASETNAEAEPAPPAGLDPAAPPKPPKGRRSRLRKRLRYLRRARELMLRDLGGLLYEIHRTGGGRIDAHAAIIGPKVARIAAADQEAHAIERALSAPRGEMVVFEPGVGGACAVCGELYANGARFCAHCGTATTETPASPAAPVEPAGAAVIAQEPAPAAAAPAPDTPGRTDEQPTSQLSAEPSSPPLGLAPAPREPDGGGAMNGHAPGPSGSDKDADPTDPLAAPEPRRP